MDLVTQKQQANQHLQADKRPVPNGTVRRFFAPILHPTKAIRERQVKKIKTKIEQEKENHLWTFAKTANYRKLGDTLAKLGRRDDAIKQYRIYLEKLMGQYYPYYADEMKTCRLISDMLGTDAKTLMRHGRYAEAAALYRKQAEGYEMVGGNNVLCLPEAEFNATKRTVTYTDVDFVTMGAAGRVMLELDETRTERRYEIARIGRERAKTARENADAAQKKADERHSTQA